MKYSNEVFCEVLNLRNGLKAVSYFQTYKNCDTEEFIVTLECQKLVLIFSCYK